jgi:acyl-CoA thioesterase-2
VTSLSCAAFDDLVENVLALRPLGADCFVGPHPSHSLGRVYGGQLAAQGLRAAATTVEPARRAHSLHVSYLGIGDPGVELRYEVRVLRESRQFSTRLVIASQQDTPVASILASFQAERVGLEHSVGQGGPCPPPESLPKREELLRARFGDHVPPTAAVPWPIDTRYVDHEPWATPDPDTQAALTNRVWMRAEGVLADDPLLHACVFAYASDLPMFEPVVYPHDRPPYELKWEQLARGEIRGATLDHTIWLHRAFRVDEWLLQDQVSPIAHGGRGFSTSRFFTADGVLVASAAQEVAILVAAPGSAAPGSAAPGSQARGSAAEQRSGGAHR